MKANEAPEKIFLDEDESWHLTNPNGDSVEYIRSDAFIEKAEKYLKSQFIKNVSVLAVGTVNINFSAAIENFVKYMKEE